WRLLVDEYEQDVTFNIYRNEEKLNEQPLEVTNFNDEQGMVDDTYRVDTIINGKVTESNEVDSLSKNYLSIPLQKPEGGTTATGDYTYSANDESVGDLDGDSEYEIILKWRPSNAMTALQE